MPTLTATGIGRHGEGVTFRDLVSFSAAERLALIYLAVVYAQREAEKGR